MEYIENMYVDLCVTQEIFHFLNDYQKVEEEKFFELFNQLYKKFFNEILTRIETCYLKFKPYDYNHFIQQIFIIEIESKDIENYYRIQLSGLISVIEKYNSPNFDLFLIDLQKRRSPLKFCYHTPKKGYAMTEISLIEVLQNC